MPVIARCDRCHREEKLSSFVVDIGPMFHVFSMHDGLWWRALPPEKNGKRLPARIYCPRCQQLYNVARRFAQDHDSE